MTNPFDKVIITRSDDPHVPDDHKALQVVPNTFSPKTPKTTEKPRDIMAALESYWTYKHACRGAGFYYRKGDHVPSTKVGPPSLSRMHYPWSQHGKHGACQDPASRRPQEPAVMQARRPLTTPPPPKPDLSLDQQRTGSTSQPVHRGRWGGNRPKDPQQLQPLTGSTRKDDPANPPQRTMPSRQAAQAQPIGRATYEEAMATPHRRQHDTGSQRYSRYREERDPERNQLSQLTRVGGEAEDRSRSDPPSSGLALLIIQTGVNSPRQPGMRKRNHYRWRSALTAALSLRGPAPPPLLREPVPPPLLQGPVLPPLPRAPALLHVPRLLVKDKIEASIIHTVVQHWHLTTTQASSMQLSLFPSQTESNTTETRFSERTTLGRLSEGPTDEARFIAWFPPSTFVLLASSLPTTRNASITTPVLRGKMGSRAASHSFPQPSNSCRVSTVGTFPNPRTVEEFELLELPSPPLFSGLHSL